MKLENDKTSLDAKTKGPNGLPPGVKPKVGADGKKINSLKRPGSPNLSEMESSGNESSRKRQKKMAKGSLNDSGASTPVPGPQRPKTKALGGDGEATDMSDSNRSKKLQKKLPVGSHSKGSPVASRAGSPAPGLGNTPSLLSKPPALLGFNAIILTRFSGSQSATQAGSPSTPKPVSGAQRIKREEIVAALQSDPDGLTIGQLYKYFASRLTGAQEDRQAFIALVKSTAKWGPDKRLQIK